MQSKKIQNKLSTPFSMKKIYFIAPALFLLISWGAWYYFREPLLQSLWQHNQTVWIQVDSNSGKIDGKKIASKIEELRNRYALKGLIYQWDAYLNNDQFWLALKHFNDALESNPWNPLLLEKIAETYFKMNKYEAAYNYYKQISNPSDTLKKQTLLSLLYSKKNNITSSIDEINEEIKALWFSKEQEFYYTTSISCSVNFHQCKKDFQDYFTANAKNPSQFWPLKEIEEAYKNYENFQLEDMFYKNALFVGTLFKQELYPVVLNIWLSLNKERPDYRPVLEMVAESLYKIGEYKSAKTWLETYIKYEPSDANAWFMMGVINLKIWEFVLSNIQLQKASDLWYTPSIQVKRHLAYNYYILQQQDRLLQELKDIVENEKDFEKEDLYLALYYHIINNQLEDAVQIAEIGNKKFPNDANIYGYYGWIFKEKWDLDSALQYTLMGIDNDAQNPFLLLNLGYVYEGKGIIIKAKINFNKVIKEAPTSEFAKQAEAELEKIQAEEEKNQPK